MHHTASPTPSSAPLPARRVLVGLIVATTLGAALIAPVASASASPSVRASCPQTVAAVGFPIQAEDYGEKSMVKVDKGALPAGITIDASKRYVRGEPTTVGASSFGLEVTQTATDGSVETAHVACTIDVHPAPVVHRIAAADRYALSVAASSGGFVSSPVAYLATGENFADALSASAIAAKQHAPLLLTPRASLRDDVLAEIVRLGAQDVVIVGGPAAVSDDVAAAVEYQSDATVTRIGGQDRYEVSRNLIQDARFGITQTSSVFVATGRNYPDALTASPAAAFSGQAVLLVDGNARGLGAATTSFLNAQGIRYVVAVGGPASLSDAVFTDLDTMRSAKRLAGEDRYKTGAVVNASTFTAATNLFVASGANFPDALSGGVLAGVSDNPLYISTPGCLSLEVFAEIGRLVPPTVTLLGGPAALAPAVDTLKPCSR